MLVARLIVAAMFVFSIGVGELPPEPVAEEIVCVDMRSNPCGDYQWACYDDLHDFFTGSYEVYNDR